MAMKKRGKKMSKRTTRKTPRRRAGGSAKTLKIVVAPAAQDPLQHPSTKRKVF